MKHLKILGLAAIAALGLMAFVGAGTASATTLCTSTKVVEGRTVCAVTYETGTVIHMTLKAGTSALLETPEGTKIGTCTGSTMGGSLGTATGTWVAVNIEVTTWEGCSQTTDNVSLGSLEIMQTAGDEGLVIGRGGNVTFGVFGVSCTYGTGEGTALGFITGGSAPELTIVGEVPKTGGGFLCPSSGRWTAQYIVTSPHAVHVVS